MTSLTNVYSYKADFPLLAEQPEIVYLDSAATTQKPAYVIA